MSTTKRLWMDTTVAALMTQNQPDNDRQLLQNLIDEGHTIVIANTAVDVGIFQSNPVWFEDMLDLGYIVIEIWDTPNDMTKKNFYWSSRSLTTQAADTFAEAIATLPDNEDIMKVAELVNKYGLPRGSWKCGTYAPPAPLQEDIAAKLGVPVSATRTEVLAAAMKTGELEAYDTYNVKYNTALARQHFCDAVITSDGGFVNV